jgi:outer membrane protein assembly factor BamB
MRILSTVSTLVILLSTATFADVAAPATRAAARPPSLEAAWKSDLTHQFEAGDCFARDGHLDIGTSGAQTRIVKVRLADGSAVWSHEVENGSYQPSYPVSNGDVVVFGTYYQPHRIVGLDDRTGKPLWSVPTGSQNMSAACYAGDRAFIGSYDRHLYAIDTSKGRLLWKAPLGKEIWSRPAAVGDLVLVGCYDGFLYALKQADGEVAWKVACGGRINGDVATCAITINAVKQIISAAPGLKTMADIPLISYFE